MVVVRRGEYEYEYEDEDEDEDVDVEEDRFQDWEAHCARAFAVEMHMDIWEGSCCMEIYRKCTGRASRARHFARACASETYMDCHKSHFVSKFTGKCWTLLPGPAFCSSLHNRNAHGHVTTATLCGNLQQKCRTPIPATILCQPAQSKCTWTLHKGHFVSKFTWKKSPDASATTSIEHRALTVTVRNPQCGHTVWEKKCSGGYVGHMKTMREILKKCVKCWIGGRNACKVWTLPLKLRKMQNSQVWRTPWFHDPPCWPFLCCAMQAAKTCEKRKRHCYTCHAGRSDRLKFEANPIDSKNIEKREVW